MPSNFHGMLSVAPAMRELFELLSRVARAHSSVLLRGETGTGKELAARAIHELSDRAAGPFVAVNCATLTPELAASELFGHRRGAFTGAHADYEGLFGLAHKGTIFLDEIAELSLEMQARLLRVLQEGSFIPLGASSARKVDVRLVCATNRSLRKEVQLRRFREDLLYRVRVVPVFLPPLVEREGDVEALCQHFVEHFNERGIRQVEGIGDEAMQRLLAYHWPGNVRELKNVIEHAFAVGLDPKIGVDDLPPELRGELPAPDRLFRDEGGELELEGPPALQEEEESRRVREALRLAKGKRAHAAELLGISRATLWRRMRALGIDS